MKYNLQLTPFLARARIARIWLSLSFFERLERESRRYADANKGFGINELKSNAEMDWSLGEQRHGVPAVVSDSSVVSLASGGDDLQRHETSPIAMGRNLPTGQSLRKDSKCCALTEKG
jgi:hypothetical protein